MNNFPEHGAFRYFKDANHTYGIVDDWYEYRNRAFEDIAKVWLESDHIPYAIEDPLYRKVV